MTDLLMPEDTGDIAETAVLIYPQPCLSVVDTERIPLGEDPTRRLTAPPPPPIQALRLADAYPRQAHNTGEIPLFPTGAELAVAGRPVRAPRPTRHALTARAGEYPVVRPSPRPHIVARRAAARRDARARTATLLLIGALWTTVAVLWAVTW